jgi:methylenetetrahydrofolate reductase (NADPH)
MNVLSHQITRLIDHGVDDFHFYTMNETLLTSHVCRWMRAGF